jgi:hypothetical protein
MPYYVGLDLGQSADYTAVSIIHDTFLEPAPGYQTPVLNLVHLERFPLRTPYPNIVDNVIRLLKEDSLHPWEADKGTFHQRQTHPTLIVDSTGVGAPVTDMFDKRRVKYIGVSIHGGDKVTSGGSRKYRVPKRDLVSSLEVPFHSGELRIAEGLELWPTLKKELLNFKRKIDLRTAHDSYEHWRESDHDDLVLATALATWWCRRKTKGTRALKIHPVERIDRFNTGIKFGPL